MASARPRWWRGIITAAVLVGIAVVIVWSRPWLDSGVLPTFGTAPATGSPHQGVATIEAVQAGHRGKHGATFFTYKV